MSMTNLKINFLGDSITEGYGAKSLYGYVDYVAEYTGAKCNNYGIAGTRIAKQNIPSDNARYDLDFCSRVDEMDNDADIVFVFGGTNDYGHGDAPMGIFGDTTNKTFYGALDLLYRKLIEKYYNIPIVIITPLHRYDENNLKGDGSKSHDAYPLKSYVEAIRKVAQWYSLPVLDFYNSSGLNPNVEIIKSKYLPDGLHPNDDGHRRLAKLIIQYIKSNYFFKW